MKHVLVATGIVALLCAVTAAAPLSAQTRAQGPWWPHPIWGPGGPGRRDELDHAG